MQTDKVIFETLPMGSRHIGVATLNRPASLNALNLPMVRALQSQLDAWRQDDAIAMVILRGAGDKAFCAGGDVRAVVESIDGTDISHGEAFFSEEYQLDYTIHTYPKPVLGWGHGVLMGGGMGLFQGASHRVVTEDVMIAMPEVTIGLFPDVGASWFLQRMPGQLGLFSALTGARLDTADALRTGLADYHVPGERYTAVLETLADTDPDSDALATHDALSRVLQQFQTPVGPSALEDRIAAINAMMNVRAPSALCANLIAAAEHDAWFAPCAERVQQGSPTTVGLIAEQFHRSRHMSLKEVLAQDLVLAVQCCRFTDFREGVRALLIDKDKSPRWTPASVDALPREHVLAHFAPPEPGFEQVFRIEHPLERTRQP